MGPNDVGSRTGVDGQWLVALTNRWQLAVGLQVGGTREGLQTALETLLGTTTETRDLPLERLLLRGYLLELALAIRHAARTLPAPLQAKAQDLSACLIASPRLTFDLRVQAATLLDGLRESALTKDRAIPDRAKTWIDEHGRARTTVQRVARAVGTNEASLKRAFGRAFGVSVAAYSRRCRVDSALAALRSGVPVKLVAHDIGCGEATLRRLVRTATGQPPSRWSRR